MSLKLNSPRSNSNKHQKAVSVTIAHWFMARKENEIYSPGTQQIFIGISILNIHASLLFHFKYLLWVLWRGKRNTFLWKDLTICSDSMSMVNSHFSSWLLFCLLIYLLLVPLGIEHRNFCVLTSMLRPCIFCFLFFIFFRSVLKVCEIVQFRSKRNLTRSSYPLPFETGEVRCALIGTDG